jgi:hypothetical protein
MMTMNAMESSSVIAAPPRLLDRTIATTKARILQAVTSSTAAQVMAVLPSAVCVMPRSWRMRASTGKAVMLMEMPMNRANPVKVALLPARSVYSK